MSTTHHSIARPEFEELAHSPTDNTPKQTAKPRLSTRKVRSDAGISKGPRKPRQSVTGHRNGAGWSVPLKGVHARGRSLRIAIEDHSDIMKMSDIGKRIYVVTPQGSDRPTVVMRTDAPQTSGAHQTVTVARFLAGEMHGGRKLHYKDGNPFNLCRTNLETEVLATGERFPIDWNKAVAGRERFLAIAHSSDSLSQVH